MSTPCSGGKLLERRAPLFLRSQAKVFAASFEQVVGHEHCRCFAQHVGRDALASHTLLQQGERLWGVVAPDQDFAVKHGAIR